MSIKDFMQPGAVMVPAERIQLAKVKNPIRWRMRTVMLTGTAVVALATGLTGCQSSLADISRNPQCVTRVSGETAFGGGIPTGKARFSAVCNDPKTVTPPQPPEE